MFLQIPRRTVPGFMTTELPEGFADAWSRHLWGGTKVMVRNDVTSIKYRVTYVHFDDEDDGDEENDSENVS